MDITADTVSRLEECAAANLNFVLDVSAMARARPADEVRAFCCSGLADLLLARVSIFMVTDDDGRRPELDVSCVPSRRTSDWLARTRDDPIPPLVMEALRTRMHARGLVSADPSTPPTDVANASRFALAMSTTGLVAVLVEGTAEPPLDHDLVRLITEVAASIERATCDVRTARAREQQLLVSDALHQLLQAGVRARSPMEAAQALANAAATALGLTTACAYLVDEAGRVSDVATAGVEADREARLRAMLVGKSASDSPVWQRAFLGPAPGPDLVPDTRASGAVRPGGLAEILGLRSIAAIPLLSSEGILGLVACGDARSGRCWSDQDRDLLIWLALQGTVVVDNARLRAAERHEASSDALTGLPNRRAFHARLATALERARESGGSLAVMQIDLDRFKEVNDQLGHDQGDDLLVIVARRLATCIREGDAVARLGGDEFAIMLSDLGDPDAPASAAVRVRNGLDAPISLGGHSVTVEASIGIAQFPQHGQDAETLLRHADRAMYAAKRSGRGYQTYHPFHDAEMLAFSSSEV